MDAEHLKPLLVTLMPRLRRFARTLTNDVADADDLMQEACLRALEHAGRLEAGAPVAPWAFRILRNTWIDETRRRRVRQGAGTVTADDAAGWNRELQTSADGAAHLAASEIEDQVLGLPHGLSAALLLVAVEGYTYREAAEILGIPAGTVASRVAAARARIAEAMREETAGAGHTQDAVGPETGHQGTTQ